MKLRDESREGSSRSSLGQLFAAGWRATERRVPLPASEVYHGVHGTQTHPSGAFQNEDSSCALCRHSSELLQGFNGSPEEICELLWRGSMEALYLGTHQPLNLLSLYLVKGGTDSCSSGCGWESTGLLHYLGRAAERSVGTPEGLLTGSLSSLPGQPVP